MRTGTAISVFVHVAALIACLVLAGVRPFEPTTAEAITVDIVTPEEAPPLPKEPDRTYDFPTLTEKEQAAPEKAQEPPQPAPAPQQSAAAKSKQNAQQATLQQKEPPKPVEQQQQPQPQEVPTAQPDITARYGTMFAMPDPQAGDFDAKASASANISLKDAAALREHLKTCSILPRSVSLSDEVRVVLRVSLTRNGQLANEPTTIEVKGAEKAPPLWRAAMDALKKCQPYAMLPPDRYNEWRMLDLSFTPKDFKGG